MKPLDHFDSCIIGAGVIGLAIGRQLAKAGRSVLILEQQDRYGSETSSRNSEVIHAGIYYPTGSLKARLCVEGKTELYQYCAANRIEHRRIGKLIVASQAQKSTLLALKQQAEANGVLDLEWVDRARLQQMEPNVRADVALFSPSTGIINSHQLMDSLAAEIIANGGLISLRTQFMAAEQDDAGFRVNVQSSGQPYPFHCQNLINSGGLHASRVARHIQLSSPTAVPTTHWCKGSYFSLQGASPFLHLVYPLPESNTSGLGVHATLDMQGNARFGPDVEYCDITVTPDYRVDETRLPGFIQAIQRYYPDLNPDRLSPAYAGMRPKLQGPDDPPQDFLIQQPSPGLIHLFGMESPGLTSCLAISRHVEALLSSGQRP